MYFSEIDTSIITLVVLYQIQCACMHTSPVDAFPCTCSFFISESQLLPMLDNILNSNFPVNEIIAWKLQVNVLSGAYLNFIVVLTTGCTKAVPFVLQLCSTLRALPCSLEHIILSNF